MVYFLAKKELNNHRPTDSPIEIGGNTPSERNAQFLKQKEQMKERMN